MVGIQGEGADAAAISSRGHRVGDIAGGALVCGDAGEALGQAGPAFNRVEQVVGGGVIAEALVRHLHVGGQAR